METKVKENSTIKKIKRGISLIVLVITIIVMIILAAAIIISLNNNGIINNANEAVEKTNLGTVKELASLKWTEAYLAKIKDIEGYVIDELIKAEVKIDNYDIKVTDRGVTVTLKEKVPTDWRENVVAMVDGVPIPKGFVASGAKGENTKNGGLVIYEGTQAVTDANVADARLNRNQFVWVPVDRATFSTANTQFKRTDYLNNPSLIVDENGSYYNLGTNYWELELDENNMPKEKTQLSDYIADNDLDLISEATILESQAMYASVKEYGGFYIARYEAGGNQIDSTTKFGRGTLSITMGKYPYNGVPWGTSMTNEVIEGGAVTLAREMYPNNSTNTTGVVSTLTYGVQWDRTLDWIKSIKGDSFSLTNSTEYGNNSNATLAVTDFNSNAKYVSARWNGNSVTTGNYDVGSWTDATNFTTRNGSYIMTTGALKKANLCNIYDMAGNMYEWTMEGNAAHIHLNRGGGFSDGGDRYSVSYRNSNMPNLVLAYCGFRPSLYIKK